MKSFSTAVHADPRTPDATTKTTSAIPPAQTAAVGVTEPYEASLTMIPNPFNCSTRYGMHAATLTRATRTPSEGMSYLRMKKSACDTSLFFVAYLQIAGRRKYDMLYASSMYPSM